MNINTRLDFNVLAAEHGDQLSVLLDLTAPRIEPERKRPPASLQVVLDRSGSMGGAPMEAAREALARLVPRLDPTDRFGVVAFDDQVEVAVPAGPLTDKDAVLQRIAAIDARGSTDLSAGYLRGIQEARRVAGDGGGVTLLLLSDGHANAGLTDPAQLGAIAQTAHDRGITTGTIGIGLGYDEQLMGAVARGGAGNARFAEEPDGAAAAIAEEVDGLLALAVQAASLTIRPQPSVELVTLWNDLPSAASEDGIAVELGSLYSEEQRKLLLTLSVPAMAELGLAQVAELELRWVELPALVERTATLPVSVNVVPGDQAAGRIPDAVVRTELAYQRAQRTKKDAEEALRRGDAMVAQRLYGEAARDVAAAAPAAPADARPELEQEAQVLDELAIRAIENGNWAMKASTADHDLKSRKRGRRREV